MNTRTFPATYVLNIGVQGVSEHDENHYTGSPCYQAAKAIVNKSTTP